MSVRKSVTNSGSSNGRSPAINRGVALYLIDDTAVSFEQIAYYCKLSILEVKAMADNMPVCSDVRKIDPIGRGWLTRADISECEGDTDARLVESENSRDYTKRLNSKMLDGNAASKRRDKPDAIAWILQEYPFVTTQQIMKLIGTTKETVEAVRNKTHWNSKNIKSVDPVELGICSKDDLEQIILQAKTVMERNLRMRKMVGRQVNDYLPTDNESEFQDFPTAAGGPGC